MSFFIQKPKLLYAPMLATFGGGSARSYGRSLGGGGPDGAIVTSNLVSYFDANTYSGSGSTWNDFYNNYTATLTNTTYSTANEGYFTFDSSGDKAITNLQRSNADFSYCCWCRLSSTAASGDEHAIDTFENSSAEWTLLGATGTPSAPVAQFVVDNNSSKTTLNGSTTFSRNQWVHIVGTRASYNGEMKLYLNASLDGTGSSTTGAISGVEPLAIGSSNVGGGRWDGDIAIVQTYSDVLTASEVLQNYNAQKWRFGL